MEETLLSRLCTLGGSFNDLRLVGCDGVVVWASRLVMASVSAVLEAALKDLDGREEEAVVIVPDLKGGEIESFVRNMERVMKQVSLRRC